MVCLLLGSIVFFSYLSNRFYRLMGWLPAPKGPQAPPADGGEDLEGKAQLARRDPGWDRERFLAFARDAFGTIQDCWSRDDLPGMRHLLSGRPHPPDLL